MKKKELSKLLNEFNAVDSLSKGPSLDELLSAPKPIKKISIEVSAPKAENNNLIQQSIKKNPLIDKLAQDSKNIEDSIMNKVAHKKSPFMFVPKSSAEIKLAAKELNISDADYQKALNHGVDLLDFKNDVDFEDIINVINKLI